MEIVTDIVFDDHITHMLAIIIEGLEAIYMRAANFVLKIGPMEVVSKDLMVLSKKTGIIRVAAAVIIKAFHFVVFNNPALPR